MLKVYKLALLSWSSFAGNFCAVCCLDSGVGEDGHLTQALASVP